MNDDDLFRSHPPEPLRVLALDYFARSDVYRQLTGNEDGAVLLRDFSKLLPRIVPYHRTQQNAAPGREEQGAATGGMSPLEYAVFVYRCLCAVAAADGKITRAEEEFLLRQIRPASIRDAVFDAIDAIPEEQQSAEFDRLLAMARGLHGRTKGSVIRLMVKAAKADRRVTEEEIDVILTVGARMDAQKLAEREVANVWGRGRGQRQR